MTTITYGGCSSIVGPRVNYDKTFSKYKLYQMVIQHSCPLWDQLKFNIVFKEGVIDFDSCISVFIRAGKTQVQKSAY